MSSPRGKLSTTDFTKIGKGAAIAAGGTIVTYIAGRIWPATLDEPELQSAIFVVSCVLINTLLKLLTDTRT